ncbi:hypothetical protein Barb7_02653 [Bacteroidales bacterium Barb7]|nr:hypothetical protein Barb7_02653 [Bacteroidales bacterium Barb7]
MPRIRIIRQILLQQKPCIPPPLLKGGTGKHISGFLHEVGIRRTGSISLQLIRCPRIILQPEQLLPFRKQAFRQFRRPASLPRHLSYGQQQTQRNKQQLSLYHFYIYIVIGHKPQRDKRFQPHMQRSGMWG